MHVCMDLLLWQLLLLLYFCTNTKLTVRLSQNCWSVGNKVLPWTGCATRVCFPGFSHFHILSYYVRHLNIIHRHTIKYIDTYKYIWASLQYIIELPEIANDNNTYSICWWRNIKVFMPKWIAHTSFAQNQCMDRAMGLYLVSMRSVHDSFKFTCIKIYFHIFWCQVGSEYLRKHLRK